MTLDVKNGDEVVAKLVFGIEAHAALTNEELNKSGSADVGSALVV